MTTKTDIKYSFYYDIFTGLYHSLLLGGEFSNCHGQGKTKEGAVMSLRLRVNQLRNLRDGKTKYLYS